MRLGGVGGGSGGDLSYMSEYLLQFSLVVSVLNPGEDINQCLGSSA